MKVGLLTFHCAPNAGAYLQAYSLQQHLLSLGHSVHIINYRPQYLYADRPKIRFKFCLNTYLFKQCRFYFTIYPYLLKRFRKYLMFEYKYYYLTRVYETVEELLKLDNDYDIIILGSDQIWNDNFNGNEDVWFGDILSQKSRILVSYAASAGNQFLSEKHKNLLKRFRKIGVREKCLQEQLFCFGLQSTLTLDPALMVDAKIWNKWFSPILDRKYILIYQARCDKSIYRLAEELENRTKCKAVFVDQYELTIRSKFKKFVASPDEFVSLIKNAEFVLTTSFHGTAFSIICQTPFYVVRLNDSGDNRIENLLYQVNLEDRMIDKSMHITTIPEKIDFSRCSEKLSILQRESRRFLDDVLNLARNADNY